MPGILFPLVYGTKYSVESIPDLSGKVIIVTGGNNGIGFATSIHLVRAGAKVYMGSRNANKAAEAIKKIKAMNFKGEIIFLKLDLMDFESTRAAAKEFSSKEDHLDVLFNNAGISGAKEDTVDADGLESTIKTNHFAPFLFTHLLLDKLLKADEPRIVNTASTLYESFKVSSDSFSSVSVLNQQGTSSLSRYNQSKFANLLFAMSLAKKQPKIISNACHPGLVSTDMLQNFGSPFGALVSAFVKGLVIFLSSVLGVVLNPPEGALTQVYLGTAPEVAKKHISGEYYTPIANQTKKTKDATEANAEKLWKATEGYFKARNISLSL
ncbi:hypothetical protein BCR37DRAFT_46591 [Protomyces lactucae-debilis]|uniref:NAD(P)-binding protein n=1 Tax=Protomyces lactucae-debilis TaxID=2754530 RepID=A0A1Y2FC65_PROLT|nr:uncharacterized protein BCR37DRAFT_46591 [Protomyces lactucae-debilis]ORY81518.1 hypothetical protein BCR37DRAFT_46591 [Protomyces lactucae-debilis]